MVLSKPLVCECSVVLNKCSLLGSTKDREGGEHIFAKFPDHNFIVCGCIKIFLGTNDHHNKTTCCMQNSGRYLQRVGHRATLKQIRYRSINLLFMVDLALIVIFCGAFTSSTNILVSFTYSILQHMEFSIKTISQTIY